MALPEIYTIGNDTLTKADGPEDGDARGYVLIFEPPLHEIPT